MIELATPSLARFLFCAAAVLVCIPAAAAAPHAPPKGLVPVTPEPITKNNPMPDAGTPPKGLKWVTPVPLGKPNSGKRPPRRTHPAVGRNAPPKGLVYVTPQAITKNNPMPDAGAPPKGLKRVTPIPLVKPKTEKRPPRAKPAAKRKPAPAPRAKAKPGALPKPDHRPKPRRKAPAAKPSPPKKPPQTAALPPQDKRRTGKRPAPDLLASFRKKYETQLAQLLKTFTEKHPDVVKIRGILQQLDKPPAPLQNADRQRLQKQIASYWPVSAGAASDDKIVVELTMILDPEGRIVEIQDNDPQRTATDKRYRRVSAQAIEAAYKCSPLWLPLKSFQAWQSLTLRLSPSG